MHLWAGTANDPIQFSLQATTFETVLEDHYEALSYTWGNPRAVCEIFCKDSRSGITCSMAVTANCYDALKSLRLPGATRILWIDAICINQDDIQERGAQVAMMRSIYSNASRVVVYLGESDDESESVLQYAHDQHESVDFPRTTGVSVPPPSAEAWRKFCSRPWFTRTWVLQELSSAQKVEVRCGSISVPWEALEDYYDNLGSRATRNAFHAPAGHQAMLFIKWIRRHNSDDTALRLLEILRRTRWCLSSDSRDKIYGVVPMLGRVEDLPLLRPDYRCSVEELFTDLAVFFYDRLGYDIFREASMDCSGGRLDSLPTWVPDWTCTSVQAASRRFQAGHKRIPQTRPYISQPASTRI